MEAPNKTIRVYKINGKEVIADGNHRLCLMHALGDTEAKVEYYDLDKVDSANNNGDSESKNSGISEKPIDKYEFSDTIKSKVITNEDFGVPGMKWGEHKKEEDEPSEKGVKKTKVTKFKTKNGKMKVTQEVKARLGGKGGAKILKGDITDVEVFAGKGGKKSFDLADKFSSTYGGKSEDWTHSKGNGKIQLQDGTEKNAEIHWFECEGIGQTKWKIKKFN